jgi:excinuclease ABC subunit C
VLELDAGLAFHPENDAEFFSLLPPLPAVCLVEPRQPGAEPYLVRTADLRQRLQRLLGPPDPTSKRLNLREFAQAVRYRTTASALEQTLVYYQNARALFPQRYRAMMRLKPAAVLKVSLKNSYPRCYVTRRIAVDEKGLPLTGAYYGPFRSRRSALAFAESFLDLFKVRRCQIRIRRDPTFPGCIYSEMKMCLAPCFAGGSKEEYDLEVGRLVSFLDTSGGSMQSALEQEREQASEQLDFERAAGIHKKIEKLDEILRGRPEISRKIEDLNAVILQTSTEEETIAFYAVCSGRIAEPFHLKFGDTGAPRSAEEAIRSYLEGVKNSTPSVMTALQSANQLGEHLALLARWFFSNPREGEIFYHEKDWPYRRILKGCARLLNPRPEQPALSKSQPRESLKNNEEKR